MVYAARLLKTNPPQKPIIQILLFYNSAKAFHVDTVLSSLLKYALILDSNSTENSKQSYEHIHTPTAIHRNSTKALDVCFHCVPYVLLRCSVCCTQFLNYSFFFCFVSEFVPATAFSRNSLLSVFWTVFWEKWEKRERVFV